MAISLSIRSERSEVTGLEQEKRLAERTSLFKSIRVDRRNTDKDWVSVFQVGTEGLER